MTVALQLRVETLIRFPTVYVVKSPGHVPTRRVTSLPRPLLRLRPVHTEVRWEKMLLPDGHPLQSLPHALKYPTELLGSPRFRLAQHTNTSTLLSLPLGLVTIIPMRLTVPPVLLPRHVTSDVICVILERQVLFLLSTPVALVMLVNSLRALATIHSVQRLVYPPLLPVLRVLRVVPTRQRWPPHSCLVPVPWNPGVIPFPLPGRTLHPL